MPVNDEFQPSIPETPSTDAAGGEKAPAQGVGNVSRREFMQWLIAAGAASAGLGLNAADAAAPPAPAGSKPTLYLIATAHNDTQWNWTVQNTIREYIPNTMYLNYRLFANFPDYTFNYEGGKHYMFYKEYFPQEWGTLQYYVKHGRWRVSGAWLNAVDVNIPSPESLFRHALYGNGFFKREFGTTSRDVYLPDCFGFGYALPTIARHSGLNAFSTQKLSWGSWIPAPFAVGRWEGVDGSFVVASLRCGSYSARVRTDPSIDPEWMGDMASAGDREVDLRYFGVGDTGGAPDPRSVQWVETGIHNSDGKVRVVNTSADQLARDLTDSEIAALPHYKGELVMTTHGTGCYTSQAAMKKYNRANELLADAAERAAVAAAWLGGPAFPGDKMREAWTRVLWHQAHDDLTGTCIPQAYTFSWNDELIALNQFASTLSAGAGAVASGLDTRGDGIPLVVYNPVAQPRRDAVEAEITLPDGALPHIRVYDGRNREVQAQTISTDGNRRRIVFVAEAPASGLAVYHARPAAEPSTANTTVSATERGVQNDRYRVTLDGNGDIASVYDTVADKELLAGAAQIQLFDDISRTWPAWEVQWDTISNPPRATLNNPVVRVVENGPARAAIEVTRQANGSTFVQQIRVAEGGDRVEIDTHVDWRTPGTLVKASFPLTAGNPNGVFDLGVGVIERPNHVKNLYEVPAQQWAGITDHSATYGTAILNNNKYGWDKPDDHTLRLTLLHTPVPGGYRHQGTNDLGKHHFSYAIAGHAGDWRQGEVSRRALEFNQPLRAFQTTAHPGRLGRSFSLLRLDHTGISVRAVKKAEESEEIVVRVHEQHGAAAKGVEIRFAGPVTAAREINASEEPVGLADVRNGRLVFDIGAYEPKSFAVQLAPPSATVNRIESQPLDLPFNLDGVSRDDDRSDGDFDGEGHTIPGELLPARLLAEGIEFQLGGSGKGDKNVMSAAGQRIALPPGQWNRVYLLASAVGGDVPGAFGIETGSGQPQETTLTVQEWTGLVGQWNSRLDFSQPDGGHQVVNLGPDGQVVGLENLKDAFVKRDTVAWVGTHRHIPQENEANIFCYLFRYHLDLPAGATALVLPQNDKIRVMAVSVGRSAIEDTVPAGYLYEA